MAYGFQKYGSQEELAKDPIKHLLEVYVKINADARQSEEMSAKVKGEAQAFFRRMEEGGALSLPFETMLIPFVSQEMKRHYQYGGHIGTYHSRSMSKNTTRSTSRLTCIGAKARLVSYGKTSA